MEKYKLTEEDYKYFELSKFEEIDAILLEDVFVKDEYKGTGCGKRFVDEVKSMGKPIILYSLESAVDFWKHQGFKEWVGSEYIYTWGLEG